MARYQGAHRAKRPNRRTRAAAILGAASLVVALFPGVPLLADGGDFSLDFAAAAPFSYDHAVGGGAWDDGTIGKSKDVVESLNGGDFACEDVVTYFTQIEVDDTAVGSQTIELDFSFAASPTGQDGVGHVAILDAAVNYGVVPDLIEGPHVDTGMVDDGNSVATLIWEDVIGIPFTGKAEVLGTVQITGLESGETVILRIDTMIDCDKDPTTTPTGELQAAITGGRVTVPESDEVRVGRQTVPFKNLDGITPANPGLAILKSAGSDIVPEPGSTVAYDVEAFNTGDIGLTLTALVDDRFGDLTSAPATTCTLPQTIPVGGSYACTFDGEVRGNAGDTHTNVVTGTGFDDQGTPLSGSDDATVVVVDVPPTVVLVKTATPGSLPEPGGVFTFGLTVTNTSLEPVTITGLTDTNALSSECLGLVGTSLAAGDSVSCSYQVTHTDPGTYVNTASVTVTDDDGSEATASATETVAVSDGPVAVSLVKSVTPGSLPEPGGVFTFGLTVTNTSLEPVTITGLTDTNALSSECLGLVGTSLAAGDSVSCSYQVTHTDPGTYVNTASVTVTDDEQNEASDRDSATAVVSDVPSSISLVKTANPTSVNAPGGTVTFGVEVTNQSAVDGVQINSLTDDIHGNLAGRGTCAVPQTIPAGGSYSCTFSAQVAGIGGVEIDVVTATGVDDDGSPVGASGTATVRIIPAGGPDSTDLSVAKTGPPVVTEGDNVSYTISVTNNGPLAEPNAVAVDTLPESFVFVSVQASQGTCSQASGVIACALGPMAANTSAIITVVATTTRFGNYVNTVVVEGDVLDDNPGNNVARATTDVVSVLPQVITTTTSTPPETLPFTGSSGGSAGGLAAALLALGALMLLAGGRRREPDIATG